MSRRGKELVRGALAFASFSWNGSALLLATGCADPGSEVDDGDDTLETSEAALSSVRWRDLAGVYDIVGTLLSGEEVHGVATMRRNRTYEYCTVESGTPGQPGHIPHVCVEGTAVIAGNKFLGENPNPFAPGGTADLFGTLPSDKEQLKIGVIFTTVFHDATGALQAPFVFSSLRALTIFASASHSLGGICVMPERYSRRAAIRSMHSRTSTRPARGRAGLR